MTVPVAALATAAAAAPAEMRDAPVVPVPPLAGPPPAAASGRRLGLVAVVAIAVVALGLGALYAAATRHREPPVAVSGGHDPAAVDAGALTGAGDRPPELLSGAAPDSPDPTLGLRPTVICRLLVDVNGAVHTPSVYRPRAELAAFEAVALDAVRTYRFRPAERAGKPVAAWVNWPVSFR